MNDKPKRRWYQFSLRTMLVFMTLVCAAAALFALFARSRHFQEQAAFHRSQLPQKDKIGRHSLHRLMESGLKAKNHKDRADAEYYFAKMRFHQQAADAFDLAARQPWRDPLIPLAPDPPVEALSRSDLEVILHIP